MSEQINTTPAADPTEDAPVIKSDRFDLKRRRHSEDIFSNYHGTISLEAMEIAQESDEYYFNHSCRNQWWGSVIYDKEAKKWREQCVHQGAIIDEFEADTPEELFNMVREKHGYE